MLAKCKQSSILSSITINAELIAKTKKQTKVKGF
jgi:hypothetical protein